MSKSYLPSQTIAVKVRQMLGNRLKHKNKVAVIDLTNCYNMFISQFEEQMFRRYVAGNSLLFKFFIEYTLLVHAYRAYNKNFTGVENDSGSKDDLLALDLTCFIEENISEYLDMHTEDLTYLLTSYSNNGVFDKVTECLESILVTNYNLSIHNTNNYLLPLNWQDVTTDPGTHKNQDIVAYRQTYKYDKYINLVLGVMDQEVMDGIGFKELDSIYTDEAMAVMKTFRRKEP